MSRLTDNRFLGEGFYVPQSKEEAKEIVRMHKPTYDEIYKRLCYYENREICGKWKFVDLDGYWYDECSVCSWRTENRDGSPHGFNYCPNCGAKMDMEVDE